MSVNQVSVIMPARNAAQTVVESVRSVLAQPEVAELVLVDDGSCDGTAELAKSVGDARVRVVPGPQKGVAAALNAGADAVTTEFVARCDADDLYVSGRFAEQLGWLHAHPEYIAISGAFASMTHSGKHIADLVHHEQSRDITQDLQRGVVISSFCTWLVRRDALLKAGGVRSWFITASDVDLQCRLAGVGKVWFEPRVVYRYRLHGSSITHSRSKEQLAFYDHWVKEFARQRAERGSDDLDDGCPPPVPEFATGQRLNSWRAQAVGQLMGRAWAAHGRGDSAEARRAALQAIRLNPCKVSSWKTLALVTARKPK